MADKFYTVPFSEKGMATARYMGMIVPADSEEGAKRLAEIHSGNMREPPELKKSETHVSTAREIAESTGSDLSNVQNYFVVDERIE